MWTVAMVSIVFAIALLHAAPVPGWTEPSRLAQRQSPSVADPSDAVLQLTVLDPAAGR